jgi:hypothetical protein
VTIDVCIDGEAWRKPSFPFVPDQRCWTGPLGGDNVGHRGMDHGVW